ncbi:MAG: replication factor C large subunit [Methanomicrobiales archaeon]|nr:replication factor C large subunit [Methanomicrobiales archaeon]
MDWAEKYRPAHLADVIGNKTAVLQIAEWAKTWTRKSKPLLIYGKPGIGKTSTAFALANDMNWEVVELNASDQRTAAVIERIAGAGSVTASLTGSARKLIILDEADNLQGNADRGGAKAIIECIRQARQPMILIANDLYGLSPELRTRCEPVQFKAVPARSIAPRLKYLCSAEKIACNETAIHAIAESAEGDIRSAVNMLYASAIGRENLTDAQVHTSQKDERVSIFSLITALFSRAGDDELLRLSYDVDDTPETIEQWVEGSLQHLPGEAAVGQAYLHLSRADEYLGYTYRRQYHTLWRYATALMLLGVADAAGAKGIHARIMPPERWQKMSTAKKQKAIRTATLNKVAGMIHVPQNTLRENYLGTISMLVANNPLMYTREMAFDADQLNFFLNDKARSAEIMKAIAQEVKQKEKEKEKENDLVKKNKKEKTPRPEKPTKVQEVLPLSPEPGPKEDPAEKKPPAKTQSTLFDGF